MSKNRTSAELKCQAREQLLGRYGSFVAAEIIYGILVSAVTMFTLFHVDLFSTTGTVIYYAILFLVQIVCCNFTVGFTYMYLKVLQGAPVSPLDIFYGFKQHADKVIIIGFLLTAVCYLVEAPYSLLFNYYLENRQTSILLAACIAFLIGEIISIYISLTFALAYFIVLDFPGYSAVETLKLSARFMKGHKGRYFYISVSFLPLALLCLVTFGIGFLWLAPYMGMTFANFYMDLMQTCAAGSTKKGEEEKAACV